MCTTQSGIVLLLIETRASEFIIVQEYPITLSLYNSIMINKGSVRCVACNKNEVYYALDCLCTLCFKCFALFGKTILITRFKNPSVIEVECSVCKKTTKGGNKYYRMYQTMGRCSLSAT